MALNPTPLAAAAPSEKRVVTAARVGVRGYAEAGAMMALSNPDAGDSTDSEIDEAADALASAETDLALASAFARARGSEPVTQGAPEPEPEPEPEEPWDASNLDDFGDLQEMLVRNRSERELLQLQRQAQLRQAHEARRAAEQAAIAVELERIARERAAEQEVARLARDAALQSSGERLGQLQFHFTFNTSLC